MGGVSSVEVILGGNSGRSPTSRTEETIGGVRPVNIIVGVNSGRSQTSRCNTGRRPVEVILEQWEESDQ